MILNNPATELTTAATDALLGFVCLVLSARMNRRADSHRWKARLWQWVFALLAASSFLGTIAHGFSLPTATRDMLWHPLYLLLGLDVALFVVGSIVDGFGEKLARRLLAPSLAAGAFFYVITLFSDGSFRIFILYEGVGMLVAIALYAGAALWKQVPGAATIALGISLTIVAAVIQASPLQFTFIWPFDHNGIFHLIQIPALVVLAQGLISSMPGDPRPSHNSSFVIRNS